MSATSFTYVQRNRKMVFGQGVRNTLGAEVSELNAQKVFLILDGGALALQKSIEDLIGSKLVSTWTDVKQHIQPNRRSNQLPHYAPPPQVLQARVA